MGDNIPWCFKTGTQDNIFKKINFEYFTGEEKNYKKDSVGPFLSVTDLILFLRVGAWLVNHHSNFLKDFRKQRGLGNRTTTRHQTGIISPDTPACKHIHVHVQRQTNS